MKYRPLAILLVLMMLFSTALASEPSEDAFVSVQGNGTSVPVPVVTDPAEGAVYVEGGLGDGMLDPVIAPSGSLVIDCTAANPNANLLLLPLSAVADLKEYDTDTEFQALVRMYLSDIQFGKDFMKSIFGSAVVASGAYQLRSLINDFANLWDRSDDPDAQNAFEVAAENSPLSLDIGLDSWPAQQGGTMNGLPIIGGVYMWVDVGGRAVESRAPVYVSTQFTLPAGGKASGVAVLHEENGKTTPISCVTSGSKVSFETTKRGAFYVVYDENAVLPQVPATGDTNRVELWLFLMTVCGCAALMLLRSRKRV